MTMLAFLSLFASVLPFHMSAVADTGPKYDITDLWVTPPDKQAQTYKVTVYVMVKNIGDAIGKSFTVHFHAGIVDIGTKVLTNLSAGDEISTSTEWVIPCNFALGMVDINASIDGSSASRTVSYTILEQPPYLTVVFPPNSHSRPWNYEAHAARGKNATLNITVVLHNPGCHAVNNVTLVIRDEHYNELGRRTGITVPANQSINQTFEISLMAGSTVHLTTEAHYGNGKIADSLTADGSGTVVVHVGTLPGMCDSIIIFGMGIIPMIALSRRKR